MRAKVLLGFLLLFYWAVSLDGLAVYPLVGEDEPWIAAAPYKLATEGIFGSDLFAGYYGMEGHHYQQQPAFHLLQAGIFKLAGVGVLQMRFLPVMLGLLLLPLTFAVGRQAAGRGVGLLAVVLLCALRFSGDPAASGVPLLDMARINRYDVGVPVMGLAALWLFNKATSGDSMRLYLATGAAAGLAGLFHLYGLFWPTALGLVLLGRRRAAVWRSPAPYAMLAGALLVWTPWLVYVASGWRDYLGQQRFVADRYDVLNVRFYVENVLREIDRYRVADVFDAAGRLRLVRPGLWISVAGLPLGIFAMLRRGGSAMRALAIALVVHVALFALLLKQKHFNYIIAWWPVAMLALAYVGALVWRRRGQGWRLLWIVLLLLLMVEGLAGIGRRHELASEVTPYEEYTARVAKYIPQGARVLGLQHYWLGLRQYDYRTWLLPLFMADPQLFAERLTLEQALERVDPDVVLVDRHMGELLVSMAEPGHRDHARYLQYQRFMRRRGAVVAGVVEDEDYGRMVVYRLGDRSEEDRCGHRLGGPVEDGALGGDSSLRSE